MPTSGSTIVAADILARQAREVQDRAASIANPSSGAQTARDFSLATCATSLLSALGTTLDVESLATLWDSDDWTNRGPMPAGDYRYPHPATTSSSSQPLAVLVPGTVVEITGPVSDGGTWDFWPVVVVSVPDHVDRARTWGPVPFAGLSGVVSEIAFQVVRYRIGDAGSMLYTAPDAAS
jgi:hypothetical protein